MLPGRICTNECSGNSIVTTRLAFFVVYVAGVAETSYVGHCFTQPWLYNERCFPVGLSAAITGCVLHKTVRACVYLYVISSPVRSICTRQLSFSPWRAHLRTSGFLLLKPVASNVPWR